MSELEQGLDEVSLNDKRVELNTFDRYKGRKNVTDRIVILSSTLVRARTHYHETSNGKKKSTFKCLSTPGKQAVCCQYLGDPDQKFGLTLLQYTTDEQGQLLTDEKLSGKVKLWVLSETRYAELSQIHREWPLLDAGFDKPQYDLTVKCTEEQYQKMTFTPCKETQYKKKKEWYDFMKQKELKSRDRLTKALGYPLTELEIMELLEVDKGGAAPTGPAAEIDVGDVLA